MGSGREPYGGGVYLGGGKQMGRQKVAYSLEIQGHALAAVAVQVGKRWLQAKK